MRRAAEADLKLNPYKYDLSNLEKVKGAVPAEHLLILAADGADTKNIVKSDRKNLDERTALAYKVKGKLCCACHRFVHHSVKETMRSLSY